MASTRASSSASRVKDEALGSFARGEIAGFTREDREVARLFHANVIARFLPPPGGDLGSVRLSPRERLDALKALLGGARRKVIASELGISVHTANEYIRSLYKRLGVSGLPDLLARYGTRASARIP